MLNAAHHMPDRAELCEPGTGSFISHADIEPGRGVIDEYAQLRLRESACACPAMRGIEEKCSRARPAPPFHHLYVADVQLLVFFRHAHHANSLAVALEHEVFRFAPATEEQIASPHEIVAAIVAVHVVARERLGERKIVHRRQAQLKRRESFGGIEHCAMKALNQVITLSQAARDGNGEFSGQTLWLTAVLHVQPGKTAWHENRAHNEKSPA